ncbi:MAG: DUF5667 domain-containing protein [Chloroflexota bacterium]
MKIDKQLDDQLKTLTDVPSRDANQSAQGRAQFLAEARRLKAQTPIQTPTRWQQILRWFTSPQLGGNIPRLATALTITLALVLGGTGISNASQQALPGDQLYPLKITLENLQLSFTNDAFNEANLRVNLADRRLSEIERLIEQKRYQDAATATTGFNEQIFQASAILRGLTPQSNSDQPIKALNDALTEQTQKAKQLIEPIPAEESADIVPVVISEPDSETALLEFSGRVSDMSDGQISLLGQTIFVDGMTEFSDPITVGMMVSVEVSFNDENEFVAELVELIEAENPNELPTEGINPPEEDGDDNSGEQNGENNESADETDAVGDEEPEADDTQYEPETSKDEDSPDNENDIEEPDNDALPEPDVTEDALDLNEEAGEDETENEDNDLDQDEDQDPEGSEDEEEAEEAPEDTPEEGGDFEAEPSQELDSDDEPNNEEDTEPLETTDPLDDEMPDEPDNEEIPEQLDEDEDEDISASDQSENEFDDDTNDPEPNTGDTSNDDLPDQDEEAGSDDGGSENDEADHNEESQDTQEEEEYNEDDADSESDDDDDE